MYFFLNYLYKVLNSLLFYINFCNSEKKPTPLFLERNFFKLSVNPDSKSVEYVINSKFLVLSIVIIFIIDLNKYSYPAFFLLLINAKSPGNLFPHISSL